MFCTYIVDNGVQYISKLKCGVNKNYRFGKGCVVEFFYEDRPDSIPHHVLDKTFYMKKRLSRIECSYFGKKYKTYTLYYRPFDGTYSYLASVKESGVDGAGYAPTEFTWNVLPGFGISSDIVKVEGIAGIKPDQQSFFSGDTDNDGVMELIGVAPVNANGHIYTDVTIYDKKASDFFLTPINSYTASGNMSLDNQFENILQGGVVAHFRKKSKNSIVIPYLHNWFDEDKRLVFELPLDGTNVSTTLKNSFETPFFLLNDFNKDGLDEISYIEKKIKNGKIRLVSIDVDLDENKDYVERETFLDFPEPLNNTSTEIGDVISSDFNGDDMIDILVLQPDGYAIFWNNNGVFTSTNACADKTITKANLIKTGDFNGDGLIDLIFNSSNGSTWKVAINTGRYRNISELFTLNDIDILNNEGAKKVSDEDSLFCCVVQDFNGDGKSDIVVQYLKDDHANICWLSAGHGSDIFVLNNKATNINKKYFSCNNRIVQGDFDGDGILELLTYGSDIFKGGSPQGRQWMRYKNSGLDVSSNKICQITDGLGTVCKIEYSSLNDVYSRGSSAVYPLMDFSMPIPVVTSSTIKSKEASYTTNYRFYNGLFHLTGKGFIGFMKTETDNPGFKTINEFKINEIFYEPYLSRSSKKNTKGGILEHHEYVHGFKSAGFGVCFIDTLSSESYEDLIGYKQGNITYEGYMYGVPATITTYYDQTTVIENNKYKNIVDNGEWILNLLEEKNISKTNADNSSDKFYTRVRFSYDSNNRVSTKKEYKNHYVINLKLVNTTLYEYDKYGNIIFEHNIPYESGDTLTTKYTYNTIRNLLSSKQEPNTNKISFTYDNYGLKKQQSINGSQERIVYLYDGLGNIQTQKKYIKTDSIITLYNRELCSEDWCTYKVTESNDFDPTKITYYDGFDREVANGIIHFDGTEYITDREFNDKCLLVYESVPHVKGTVTGLGKSISYDSYNRPLEIAEPDGNVKKYEYLDYACNVTENGVTTYYEYDHNGRVILTTDASGDVRYNYNVNNDLTSIDVMYMDTDDVIQTKLSRDWFGRQTVVTLPDGSKVSQHYDKWGYISSKYNRVSIENCTNNKYGEICEKSYEATNKHEKAKYTYDTKHQLIKVESPRYLIEYTYDLFSRKLKSVKKTVYADNDTSSIVYKYNYEKNSRIKSIETTIKDLKISLKEDFEYTRGWLTSVKINGLTVWNLDKEDWQGRISETSDALNKSYMSFDNVGHMIKYNVKGNDDISMSYEYDSETDNLIFDGYNRLEYDELNRLTAWGTCRYFYDYKGNITKDGQQEDITYDGLVLKNVSQPKDDSWGSFQQNIEYCKFSRPYCISENGRELFFAYGSDGERLHMSMYEVEMKDSTNIEKRKWLNTRVYCDNKYESIKFSDGRKYHLYYVNGDALTADAVAMICEDTLRIFQIYRNFQGSIIAISDSTDIYRFAYDPWGRPMNPETGDLYPYGKELGEIFIRGFLGQEYLAHFGLINLNARLYNPFAGRFLSPDPIFVTEGGPQVFNNFAYCNNNPCRYIDPDGEMPLAVAALLFGFLRGAVSYSIDAIMNDSWNFSDFLENSCLNALVSGASTAISGGVLSKITGLKDNSLQKNLGYSIFKNTTTKVLEHKLKDNKIDIADILSSNASTIVSSAFPALKFNESPFINTIYELSYNSIKDISKTYVSSFIKVISGDEGSIIRKELLKTLKKSVLNTLKKDLSEGIPLKTIYNSNSGSYETKRGGILKDEFSKIKEFYKKIREQELHSNEYNNNY